MQIVSSIMDEISNENMIRIYSLKRQEKHLHQYLLAELGTK